MLSKIKNTFKNRYIKNITVLASGTFLSQLIVILFLPILSRVYNPEEFGLYSFFLSITASIAIISTFTFERAIVLPKKSSNANLLVILSCLLCILNSIIVATIIFFFQNKLIDYFGGSILLLYLVPLRVLQLGLQQVLDELSVRNKFYKSIATLKASNSFIVSLSQLTFNFLIKLNGLIIGKFLGDIILILSTFFIHIKNKTLSVKNITFKKLLNKSLDHLVFPKFYLPQIFFNTISLNLPFIMLPLYYSLEVAGLFGMAIRILEQPIRLISSSTQSVYYQKASQMFSNSEDIYDIFIETTSGLFKVSILPAIIIFISGPQMFSFFLGSDWYQSGVIAQILIIWLFFGFLKTPTTMTFSILSLQKIQMYVEFVLLILRFIAILAGYYLFDSYIYSIILYVIPSLVLDIFQIIYIKYHLKNISNNY